jgi:uncharacterized protein (TIGR00369 family)
MTDQPEPNRSLLIQWDDPASNFVAARELSGLEHLRRIITGELPLAPIMQLMSFRPIEAEAGRVVFAATPGEQHYNPIGMVHGGLAATLLDSAMGCVVHSMLPAGVTYTTLELKTNFLRRLTHETGEVRATGTVLHLGRSTATAESRLTDAAGRLYAHATTTCMIFRG